MRTVSIIGFAAIAGSLSLHAQLVLTGTSYTQDFDSIASGLPTGWGVYTSATSTELGTASTIVSTAVAWNATMNSSAFRNISSDSGVSWGASTTLQEANTDRALGWRPFNAASRNGAITLTLANTAGLSNFNLSFSLFVANDVSGSQNYAVEYRVGDSGSFTTLGSIFSTPSGGSTGFSATTYSFDSIALAPLADQSSTIYLRIRGTNTSGSGDLDTIGLDNFALTYAAVPEASAYGGIAGLVAFVWTAVRRRQRTVPPTNQRGAVNSSTSSLDCTSSEPL